MTERGTIQNSLIDHNAFVQTGSSAMGYLRERSATAWVTLFFAIYNINVLPKVVPLVSIAGFIVCCFLYHRELYYFVVSKRIVVLYLLIVLLSATWSTVPTLTIWYGLQLCITAGTAILIGIAATPRQIVRGIFAAMAIVIIASIVSGRQGASAAGSVLVGVTGGKTTIGMAAVALVGSGFALLFDSQQPLVYRLSTFALIPLGAYIATHVEAATAKVTVVAFPAAFLGFLALRYLTPAGRWALIGVLLVVTIAFSITIATSDLSLDADQKILGALHKDSTLTGRTLMWDKADQWIKDSPAVGYGFRAFWASGSSDSIGILHHFGLIDPRGFQLHNTVKEVRVDTGLLGLGVFFATAMFFLYYAMSFVFLYPSPSSSFIAVMYLMTLALIPIDTIIGVFFPPTAFFYVCGTAAIVHFMNRTQQINHVAASSMRVGRSGNFTFFRRRKQFWQHDPAFSQSPPIQSPDIKL